MNPLETEKALDSVKLQMSVQALKKRMDEAEALAHEWAPHISYNVDIKEQKVTIAVSVNGKVTKASLTYQYLIERSDDIETVINEVCDHFASVIWGNAIKQNISEILVKGARSAESLSKAGQL